MKTYYELIKEAWTEREFQVNTIRLKCKFHENEVAILKKGSEHWDNNGQKTFKKEHSYGDREVEIMNVDKAKSKANGEIWYMVNPTPGKKQSSIFPWYYIVAEKDLLKQEEHSNKLKDSSYIFLHLTQILNANGKVSEHNKELELNFYTVHRNGGTLRGDVFAPKNYTAQKLTAIADFWNKEDAEKFMKDCYSLFSEVKTAPEAIGDKGKVSFTIEKGTKHFTVGEVEELLKKLDKDWTIDKARHEVRGEHAGKSLGIV